MRFKLTEELETNIDMLASIRNDNTVSPAVRVQAMQAMIKMMKELADEKSKGVGTEKLTPADILQKIRSDSSTPKTK